jgi:hypothetical protein
MIFPGGNRQALRSIWHFKRNDFRWSHGWAKIARDNQIPIVPITFKGSHFVNPIFLSGEWVSKLLILPWILGLKLTSISLGQIIAALGVFFAAKGHIPIFANLILVYFTFIFTPLLLIIPFPISMKIHPVIMPADFNDQKSLENKMAEIMQSIYS